MSIRAEEEADISRRVRKMAPTPFMLFRRQYFSQLQRENPKAKIGELTRVLQQRWKDEEFAKERQTCIALSKVVISQIRDALYVDSQIQLELARRKASKDAIIQLASTAEDASSLRIPRFSRVIGHFGRNEKEQRKCFQEAWTAFSDFHRDENLSPIAERKIDLFALYRDVVSLGGFDHVSERALWDTVAQRCDLELPDKSAALLLQAFYFNFLEEFESAYQLEQPSDEKNDRTSLGKPFQYSLPPDPINELPIAPFVAGLFSSNYYRVPGVSAILFALRSRVQEDAIWGINQLLLVSYNQNRPFNFEEHPAMLEILVALLQNQLLVVDTSELGSRHQLPNLSSFFVSEQTENHAITWPDVVPALLVILRNFSFITENHVRIATHTSCIPTCLKIASQGTLGDLVDDEEGEEVSCTDLACDITARVARHHVLSTATVPLLSRLLLRDLCAVSSNATRTISRQRRALQTLAQLTMLESNRLTMANHISADVFGLMVALVSSDNDDIAIDALEAVYRVCALGGPFMRVLVQKTNVLERVTSSLERHFAGGSAEVACRTASAALAALYTPEENRNRFVPYEGILFRACSRNYEASHHLAPVLRASALRRA